MVAQNNQSKERISAMIPGPLNLWLHDEATRNGMSFSAYLTYELMLVKERRIFENGK